MLHWVWYELHVNRPFLLHREVTMLTARQESLLKIIVGEYIQTATPVASQSLARKHRLGVSPATIRNEMASLEEGGYITRPHTSAGGVPADKGYRHYVEVLLDEPFLTPEEQHIVRSYFRRVEQSPEAWTRVSAGVLSNLVQNLALATVPTTSQVRLKHLELVPLQEPRVLLVLILQGAKVKEQVLQFNDTVPSVDLTTLGHRLTDRFQGHPRADIAAQARDLVGPEQQVIEAILRLMEAAEERSYEEPVVVGMRHVLSQPEFATVQIARALVETFEEPKVLASVLEEALARKGFRVVIGAENREEALRSCTIILARYGAGDTSGTIGVLGPTRMDYSRTIAAVRYLAEVMTELVDS
ncbi:MAG: heat-inducible transcription repressor HrcA [Chloroflexi bacterium]|nr:heat-inducible transcription repressor HrcA [Chloroflexota bacterium]